MQINKLSLTNFRAFQQADFDFQPGMNLIVGINGVGKSTILDALRVMLSQVLPRFTLSKSPPLAFGTNDISVGKGFFFANLEFMANGIDFSYDTYRPREHYSPDFRQEIREEAFAYPLNREERIRLRREKLAGYNQPEFYELQPDGRSIQDAVRKDRQPLAVFFSTRRSVLSGSAPSRAASAGGPSAAFSEALLDRELRWREYAEWWLVQQTLAEETNNPIFGRHLEVLGETVTLFLDHVHNLRVSVGSKPTLLLDKDDVTLDVGQLSDGERGMISLVLDLARRLAQANPGLAYPLRDGQAVVLIDELDLHLHPRWQREVVEKLPRTFPNCQFIATTHSPQIIGEANTSGLILLERKDHDVIVSESNFSAYGFDSSWILRHLMGTESRSLKVLEQINKIEAAIEDGNLEEGRTQLEALRKLLSRDDDEVKRLEASINNLEALANEVNIDEADQ